jgi:hypothetical protein
VTRSRIFRVLRSGASLVLATGLVTTAGVGAALATPLAVSGHATASGRAPTPAAAAVPSGGRARPNSVSGLAAGAPIVRASAAPTTALKGTAVTFSGSVVGQPAGTRVVAQRQAGSRWLAVGSSNTSRAGIFTLAVRVGRPAVAHFRMFVPKQGHDPGAVGAVLVVRVVSTSFVVRLARVGRARLLPGDRVRFAGVVSPRARGLVALQRLDPGSTAWLSDGTAPLNSESHFLVTGLAPNSGLVRFRVAKSFTTTVAAGVSAPQTVRVAAAGHRIVGKPGTVTAPRVEVVKVRPAGAKKVVTLRAGGVVPKVGGHLVLNSAPGAPAGLLGTVSAVHRNANGSTSVTTTPAALDQVFSDFAVAADLNLLAPAHPSAAHAAASESADYSIDSSDLTCDASQRLAANVSVGIEAASAAVKFNLASQSVSAVLTIVPEITATITGKAKVSCSWDGPTLLTLPIPGAPYILVELSPSASFDGSGNFTLTGKIAVTMQAGFTYSGGDIERVASLIPTATTSFTGHAEAHVYLEDHITISVAGRAGIDLAAGPGDNLSATVDTTDPTKTCVDHYADMDASASLFIDVFFYSKSKTLAEGHFARHTWYDGCVGNTAPPGGPSPVVPAVALSTDPVNAVNTDWCGTTVINGYAFVDWSVTGFEPGESLSLALPDEDFGVVGTTASDGSASGSFELGEHLPGFYDLVATGSSGDQAATTFDVVGSACTNGTVNDDGTYSFTHWAGAGSDPGTEVDFSIDGSYIGSTTVDGSGSYDQALDGGADVTVACTSTTPATWVVDTTTDGVASTSSLSIYCSSTDARDRTARRTPDQGGVAAETARHAVQQQLRRTTEGAE